MAKGAEQTGQDGACTNAELWKAFDRIDFNILLRKLAIATLAFQTLL